MGPPPTIVRIGPHIRMHLRYMRNHGGGVFCIPNVFCIPSLFFAYHMYFAYQKMFYAYHRGKKCERSELRKFLRFSLYKIDFFPLGKGHNVFYIPWFVKNIVLWGGGVFCIPKF